MKKIIHITHFVISLICINAIAMEEQSITYHKATGSDATNIVKVINEHGINDRTKIVILPKQFREFAVKVDLLKERLYCAKEGSDIVGFKKLFIITDPNELEDITHNEIRCYGKQSCLVDARRINPISKKLEESLTYTPALTDKNSIFIYFGGDYTIPTHRDRKINSTLINHAFDTIKEDTINIINKKKLEHIVLLYGLTKANAGENGTDRTPSIIKAFTKFTEEINPQCNNNPLFLSRYKAFMPTFDPEATECKPLPDEHAIAGYGNVLQRQVRS